MSKEQTRSNTPITADYIKKEILKGLSEVFRGKTIYMKDIEVSIEQYAELRIQQEREKWKEEAKQEVLEALEPQKELIEELLTIFDGYGVPNIKYVTRLIKEYYETEVKPKYE